MNFRPTFNDRKEIAAIIKGFGEKENEQVYEQVESIVEGIKSNPIEHALTMFLSRHFDIDLLGIAQDDTDAQDMAHKFLWDYTTIAEQHRLGVSIFEAKRRTQEAA